MALILFLLMISGCTANIVYCLPRQQLLFLGLWYIITGSYSKIFEPTRLKISLYLKKVILLTSSQTEPKAAKLRFTGYNLMWTSLHFSSVIHTVSNEHSCDVSKVMIFDMILFWHGEAAEDKHISTCFVFCWQSWRRLQSPDMMLHLSPTSCPCTQPSRVSHFIHIQQSKLILMIQSGKWGKLGYFSG